MKKVIFTLIICLIVLISFYLYFKPDKNYSLSDLLQESGKDSGENTTKTSISTDSNSTDITSQVDSLKTFIENAPSKK